MFRILNIYAQIICIIVLCKEYSYVNNTQSAFIGFNAFISMYYQSFVQIKIGLNAINRTLPLILFEIKFV